MGIARPSKDRVSSPYMYLDLFPSDSVCGIITYSPHTLSDGNKSSIPTFCQYTQRSGYAQHVRDHGGENVEEEVRQGDNQVDLFRLGRILLTSKYFCIVLNVKCFCPQDWISCLEGRVADRELEGCRQRARGLQTESSRVADRELKGCRQRARGLQTESSRVADRELEGCRQRARGLQTESSRQA